MCWTMVKASEDVYVVQVVEAPSYVAVTCCGVLLDKLNEFQKFAQAVFTAEPPVTAPWSVWHVCVVDPGGNEGGSESSIRTPQSVQSFPC